MIALAFGSVVTIAVAAAWIFLVAAAAAGAGANAHGSSSSHSLPPTSDLLSTLLAERVVVFSLICTFLLASVVAWGLLAGLGLLVESARSLLDRRRR